MTCDIGTVPVVPYGRYHHSTAEKKSPLLPISKILRSTVLPGRLREYYTVMEPWGTVTFGSEIQRHTVPYCAEVRQVRIFAGRLAFKLGSYVDSVHIDKPQDITIAKHYFTQKMIRAVPAGTL